MLYCPHPYSPNSIPLRIITYSFFDILSIAAFQKFSLFIALQYIPGAVQRRRTHSIQNRPGLCKKCNKRLYYSILQNISIEVSRIVLFEVANKKELTSATPSHWLRPDQPTRMQQVAPPSSCTEHTEEALSCLAFSCT